MAAGADTPSSVAQRHRESLAAIVVLPEAQGDLCEKHCTPAGPVRRTRGERPSPPPETVELTGVKRARPGAIAPEEDEEVRPAGRDPRKGLERSLKQCEDKLLDVLGPLARIFDMVEQSYVKGTDLDINLLRAICFLGNANAGFIAERRRAIVLRISPKLGEMAKETSEETKGLLFGDGMIKALGKYVHTFTALDKAHS
ncbi:hypothetical protein NDU88_005449 [Pleurodeles waltl]|uniref:Uncharacterized protein n=1 Tax=Pleurodeles waltl TaxID=8319 RepID=A0AAV7TXA8_PLEWA|nr:hypothetical protein NDU88_005449 [Pleurodeles waltl]